MINYIKKNKRLQILIIQIIFLILSIGFACGSVYINRIALTDSSFHYSRLFELSKDIKELRWPSFNLNSMVPYGDAISTFYPWGTLLIFIPIMGLFHSVTITWSIIIAIIMVLDFEVSFFACKTISHSNLKSVIFSIIYGLSTITMSYAITDCDIGAFLGMAFAPLVIFGWIHWLKNNHWKMMTIGMILISFSHILASAIMFVTLIILTLVCINLVTDKKQHIICLLKGLFIWVLSISVVWLPILILLRNNSIEAPISSMITENLAMGVIPDNLGYLFVPYMYRVWTFSDFVCLLLSIIYWKKLTKLDKRFIYVALFYIFLNFSWVKIPLLVYTPIGQIQFMCRICFASHLLFSIVLTKIIINILIKRWYIQNVISLLGVLLALNIGCVYLSYACLDIAKGRQPSELLYSVAHHHRITTKQNNIVKGHWKANNYLYNTNVFKHGENYVDYLPISVVKHDTYLESGISENNKNYIVRPKNNGIIKFYMGHNHKKLLMPMTMYNKQKYHLKLDGKYINPTKSFNKKIGYVELHNVNRGWHRIQLIIPIMDYRYIALATSIIGLGLLTFLPDKRRYKENDKK